MVGMFAKLAQNAAAIILLTCLFTLTGCKRPWSWPSFGEPSPTPTPTATPAPTPTPKPTPIYIPQKRLEVSRLFNGMQVRTKLESEPGETATKERETEGSYALELNVKVKVPKPHRDLEALSKLNPSLPVVLPGLAQMLPEARVSEKYEALYGRKLAKLQRNLPKLDALLSRHNFFDCETILELRDPQSKRTAVLIQGDMDVDTDGSDPDRLPAVDANDPTFQPLTSYRWPKRTILTNPFLPTYQAKLRGLENELTQAKHLGEPRLQALRDAVGAARYEVGLLKTCSFLLAATDPYVVLPGLLVDGMDPAFQPRVGDYCAVIYGNTIYPAIVGDIGPRDLVGEASYRFGKELNPETTAIQRPVSNLKVTYLYFPNSADQPFGPPDLPKMRERVEALLNDMGGYGGTLHTWVELSKPAPTPTPTPTPSPTPLPIPGTVSPWISGTSTTVSSGTSVPAPARLPGLPSAAASPTPIPAAGTPVVSPTPVPNASASPTSKPSGAPKPVNRPNKSIATPTVSPPQQP